MNLLFQLFQYLSLDTHILIMVIYQSFKNYPLNTVIISISHQIVKTVQYESARWLHGLKHNKSDYCYLLQNAYSGGWSKVQIAQIGSGSCFFKKHNLYRISIIFEFCCKKISISADIIIY